MGASQAFRMLCVIDEFTRERLAIRVGRKRKAAYVIDVLSDLFILRGAPGFIRSDNERAGVRRPERSRLDRSRRRHDRIHHARNPAAERLREKLQRPPAR